MRRHKLPSRMAYNAYGVGIPEKRVYLSFGSNLGDREANLRRAIARLEDEHIRVIEQSSWYETEPQDVANQPWFLNFVAVCETRCFPLQLLTILQGIERELGRAPKLGSTRGGPRLIDIDILLFADVSMALPQLTIPHPRMLQRRFVLEPLVEIAPDLRHPATGELYRTVLAGLDGQQIKKL